MSTRDFWVIIFLSELLLFIGLRIWFLFFFLLLGVWAVRILPLCLYVNGCLKFVFCLCIWAFWCICWRHWGYWIGLSPFLSFLLQFFWFSRVGYACVFLLKGLYKLCFCWLEDWHFFLFSPKIFTFSDRFQHLGSANWNSLLYIYSFSLSFFLPPRALWIVRRFSLCKIQIQRLVSFSCLELFVTIIDIWGSFFLYCCLPRKILCQFAFWDD